MAFILKNSISFDRVFFNYKKYQKIKKYIWNEQSKVGLLIYYAFNEYTLSVPTLSSLNLSIKIIAFKAKKIKQVIFRKTK